MKKLLEIHVVVDEDGDYEVGADAYVACERYDDNIGGDSIKRAFSVALNVTLPKVMAAGTIDVPDEEAP